MTLGAGQNVEIADLLVEHASDGTHSGASNLQSGLNASKSATPDVGDVYLATDTSQYYACYVDDAWTQIGAGADEKAKVSSDDTTAGYLNGKLVASTNITFTENNPAGNETLGIATSAAVNNHVAPDSTHVPANVIAYTTDAAAPTGWTAYTALYGRFVVGFNTNIAGTVGTALSTLENRTHTHTGPSHQHLLGMGTPNPTLRYQVDGGVYGTSGTFTPAQQVQNSANSTVTDNLLTSAAGTGATGTAATGDSAPFIQLLPLQKS